MRGTSRKPETQSGLLARVRRHLQDGGSDPSGGEGSSCRAPSCEVRLDGTGGIEADAAGDRTQRDFEELERRLEAVRRVWPAGASAPLLSEHVQRVAKLLEQVHGEATRGER